MIKGFFRFPQILKPLFPDAVIRMPKSANKVYLTFDDGPSKAGTEDIISTLQASGIDKAAFFCTGENIVRERHLAEMIRESGYTVANHGFKHLNGWKTDVNTYMDNCIRGAEVSRSGFFRPPYTRITPMQYSIIKEQARIIFWDLLLYDWDYSVNTDLILGKAEKLIRPGSVIALHDKENMCANRVLDSLIVICREKGFDFGDIVEDLKTV